MAYNSSKGPQTHGDVKYEGDAEDTQIDFENDYINLKTNGVKRLEISGSSFHFSGSTYEFTSAENVNAFRIRFTDLATSYLRVDSDSSNVFVNEVAGGKTRVGSDVAPTHTLSVTGHISSSAAITGSALHAANSNTVIDTTHFSSSLPVSASSFWANGVQITSGGGGGAISTYNNAADNRVITSVDSNTVQGEANLTFDGDRLTVAGDINMSGMTGSAISGTLSMLDLKNGTLQVGNEEVGTGITVKIRSVTDSDVPLIVKSPSHDTILAVTGSGKVAVGGVYVDAKFNITGSNEEKFLAIKSTDVNPVLEVDNNHLSASVNISASAFFGSGQHLTNLPSAAITTYNSAADNRIITSVNSTTVQGESGLTFDGSVLNVTGDVSGSGVLSANEIKCSGSVTAVSFAGDGSALTGLPSAAISTYNTSGDNRIVTSVNSTTVQGEENLTFDGETLTVTGDLTASVGMVSAHIASSGHISASLGITGSALHAGNFTTVIDTTHVSSSLNVSASGFYGDGSGLTGLASAAISTYNTSGDNRIITSVNSTTVQGESRLTFDGETLYVSGNMKMQNNFPKIEFSSSAGSGLGFIGFNTSDNIIVQNSATNKHIVFKANDEGTVKEGLRLDGAVPEVVVNQNGASGDNNTLVDFRVESDNNTHMLYVDGANDKIGINTDTPSHPLSVIGHVSASLGITGSSIHAGDFTTVINSTHVSSSVSISASSFWANGVQLTAGGGGGSPGGSDGQVQYNNGGSFGGESNFVYDDGNDRVGIGTSAPSHTLSVTGSAQVTGNLTVSGSLRSTGTIHVTHHCFANTGTAAMMVPFITETETTSGDRRHQMIAPFPGRLLKVWVRTKTNINGNCTVALKKATDGTEDFAAGGTEVEAVTVSMTAANTSFEFPMTGSNQYSAGEIVGVQVNPTSNGSDYNVTCIWEYDNSVI